MKLLVLNWQDRSNPLSGGAEIHLHEVFGRLAAAGHDVTLLVSGWKGGPARALIDGMDVHRVGGRHSYLVKAPPYYRSVLQDRSFDLIVEDLNKVPLFTPYWAKEPLVLLVHHLFGETAFQEATFPIAAATWLLERPVPHVYRSAPVQAVSHSTAEDLVRRGFRRESITVIPNGVDLGFYSPDPDEPRFPAPTMLYLGRVKKYKRIDLVVRALARLRKEGVAANLIVAGKGNASSEVRQLAEELGIPEAVRMPGYVDENEKRSLFRRSWVHVLTSSKEGWGISNLEAAACGTPTVASDSPGLRDSVVHGKTGFLVPHGDVAALAAHLRMILEDEPLRQRLSDGAYRFALEFSWDRAAQRTEAHLRSVLDRRSELAMKPGRGRASPRTGARSPLL